MSDGRRRAGLLLVALGLVGGQLTPGPAAAEESREQKLPPLEVRLDPKDVDLERGQLVVRASRPAARATLKVIGVSGAVLEEVAQSFDGAPAGAPLRVRWTPRGQGEAGADAAADGVARLELFVYDTHDYYKGVALTPWSVEIPHADVVFATDSAEIRASEREKLLASLARIREELGRAGHLGTITLFIVAHTDTVGSSAYNSELSTRRARAIAAWFRAQGLKIPIAYDGVGESALKVKTADGVDEARNRRADYMLGVEPPRFKNSGVSPSWKRL